MVKLKDVAVSDLLLPSDLGWCARRLPELFKGFAPVQPQVLRALHVKAQAASQLSDVLALVSDLTAGMGRPLLDWKESLDALALPAVCVDPYGGLFLVHQRTESGWLIEGVGGRRHVEREPSCSACLSLQASGAHSLTWYRTAAEFMWAALRSNRRLFMHAAVASALANVLVVMTSLYSMQVYDRVVPTRGVSTLYALTIGVCISIVLELITKWARAYILDQAIRSIDLNLSSGIFERLLSIRIDQLPATVGTLSAQLRSYETIRSFGSSVSLYVMVDAPFAIFFIFVIFLIGGPYMAAVPTAFLVVALAVGLYHRREIERSARAGMAASNRKLGLMVEVVEGAETIKATGSGWHFLSRWNALSHQGVAEDLHLRHLSESAGYMAAFFQQISYVMLIAVGAYIASTETALTAGSIVACSIIAGRVLQPVAMLPGLMVQWANAKAALESIERIYRLARDNQDVEHPMALENLAGAFAVQQMEFSYAKGLPPAVKVAGLKIEAGERVGILGTVGAGKSTLLKLLAGIYQPTGGSVFVDGIDLRQVSRVHLGNRLGYLSQDPRLFSGTLRDNLTLGVVNVRDQDLLQACESTGLAQMVAGHPKGLDLPIAEGGSGLSGGQRQLVAITRMLLSSPDVWLMDEPTASMDEGLEQRIVEVLHARLRSGKTVVVATHKMPVLQLVDRVIVVSQAGIVMDGPRDEVLRQLHRPRPAAQVPPRAQLAAAQPVRDDQAQVSA